jgi:hypothetical protein
VGFVVENLAQGQVFSEFFGFPSQYHSAITYVHLSLPHEVCNSPNQAAHYHTVGTLVSTLTQHLVGTEERSSIFIIYESLF